MSTPPTSPPAVFTSRQARRLRKSAESVAGLKRIQRPVTDERGRATFSLAYVRTSPEEWENGDGPPVLIIPGGPGLASALPYAGLRKKAVKRGLDVLMVEHRGVGLSRRTASGEDLPLAAMRISLVVDDIRAVLDREGIDRVLVVGSSYGSYLATAFAATLPSRVAGLVLDSPLLAAGKADSRDWSTALLHDGTTGDDAHRRVARKVRETAAGMQDGASRRDLGRAARIVYEFAGLDTLDALLNQLAVGRARTTWAALQKLGASDTGQPIPYWMEFDRVAEIAFRELDYADTDPSVLFDGGAEFSDLAQQYSAFSAEPVDTAAALSSFDFPVVALSGDRDLRTPRPVAHDAARRAPQGLLATVPDHGHSALDTHEQALFAAIDLAQRGSGPTAPQTTDQADVRKARLDGLTRSGGPSAMMGGIIRARLAADRLLPSRRRPHRHS
ncbi:alpha/beta fold hydrolase [Brevibacterium yomogidense]|uniref:alpha/beta fold hydrolase n=1 Tax=Brevibacterium yomogidense TaxID=946573 RepID=UPI0018DFE904|nr:alpha/beta hydrolase [Brevibacterium yomogidense]